MKRFIKYIPLGLLVLVSMITGCEKSAQQDDPVPNDSTITDIDGNVYKIVKIGTQTWMAENLKVTQYRDGTPIPNVKEKADWFALNTGAYCDHENKPENAAVYGKLYNWFAVTNEHKLAPAGWHIPTDDEWNVLYNYIGGTRYDGGKLQEQGTKHWVTDTGASNSTGFTGIPGECREDNLYYPWGSGDRYSGYWWSATQNTAAYAWYMTLYVKGYIERHEGMMTNGYSVRCIKD